MNSLSDVIAAIATPVGTGGIAVIRVSGIGSIAKAETRFRGKRSLISADSQTAHFGTFVDASGFPIDEVVVTIFRYPHSYTTEDTVEISCHGGSFIAHKILSSVFECGIRPAEPGEFTKRAFLNGRIDLSQAEAVAQLIYCKSERALQSSLEQLQGSLSTEIRGIRQQILDLCSLIEVEIDFSEEGIEFADSAKIEKELSDLITSLTRAVDSYTNGKIYREGLKVVLTGAPNVGKSSIFNALLEDNRAIVTQIPGTTRDAIQESVIIDGVLLTIVDTAGIRNTDDVVEREGVARSMEELRKSDIIVVVVDAMEGYSEVEHMRFVNYQNVWNDKKFILVLNKIDLAMADSREIIKKYAETNCIATSALRGIGIDDLRTGLRKIVVALEDNLSDGSVIVTNLRHYNALWSARDKLISCLQNIFICKRNDLIAIDLRIAVDRLGEIIGVVYTDDLLENIFAKFCIGK